MYNKLVYMQKINKVSILMIFFLIIVLMSIFTKAYAQTCTGTSDTSCTYNYAQCNSYPGVKYYINGCEGQPGCTTQVDNTGNAGPCTVQTLSAAGRSCVNFLNNACGACVPNDTYCTGTYLGDEVGTLDPVFSGCDVAYRSGNLACGSLDMKACESGCAQACTTGQTNCTNNCTNTLGYNHCGTVTGTNTCYHNQPQTCNLSPFSVACSQFYNNCDGAAGYTCGGSVCEKTMGGRITDANTGAGIANVAVGLNGTAGSGLDYTDANGNWSIGGLNYQGSFTFSPNNNPGAYGGTPCNQGYLCGTSNPANRTGTVGGSGDCGTSCNFTFTPGEIGGHVYIDYNHNGAKDGGDTGIANVTVSAGGKTDTTDANGYFQINYLNSGTYTVTVTVPTGYGSVTTSKSVTIGPNNLNVALYITPLYKITGNVFNDTNLDLSYEAGTDSAYTTQSSIKITGPVNKTVSTSTGDYDSGQVLTAGTYTVSYNTGTTPLPLGYRFTTPSSWTVTLGDPTGTQTGYMCDKGASPDAGCTNPQNGSIANLNIGVTNENDWSQNICADGRYNEGYSQLVPDTASCGGTSAPYAIIQDAALCPSNPGVLFSGSTDPNYGAGSGASTTGMVVGNSLFPESYNSRIPNTVATSYSFVTTTLQNLSTSATSLTSICPSLTNCVLSEDTPGGVYTTTAADGPVTISVNNADGTTKLGQTNYTFAIGGNLTLASNITLQDGYTAVFTSGGDIHVASSVGETDWTSLTPDLEGLFSADKSFILDAANPLGQQCLANGQPKEKKLNIKGSVAVNAANGGGTIQNNREGCLQDLSCPAITFSVDPLQLLHAPGTLKPPYTYWQELNP